MEYANFKERLGAYIIDVWIVFLVTSLIATFVDFNQDKVKVLNAEIDELTSRVLNNEISFDTYFGEYASIAQDIDRNNAIYNVVNAFVIIGFFIVIPYFNDGMSIGKRILKIKVVRDDGELLSLNNLVIRNFITTSLAYMLISLSLLYITPTMFYFWIILFLSFMQFLLVILSAFMVIYRRDKRGLHDMLAHTSVIKNR